MTLPYRSELYAWMRSDWPYRPYPLVVDHLDTPSGRVCPAASLFGYGQVWSERMKEAHVGPGAVVSAEVSTWLAWMGVLQASLRRGAAFWAELPGEASSRIQQSNFHCDRFGVSPVSQVPEQAPSSLFIDGAWRDETEVLDLLSKQRWTDELSEQGPVWVCPNASSPVLTLLGLLRAKAEIHVGLARKRALAEAEAHHHWCVGPFLPTRVGDLEDPGPLVS